jgi:hypothetical protein
MAGYPNSLLVVPSFCDNQQSTWWDVPLEGLHTGTTPTPMKRTKVSYYASLWLWSLVVVPSCTKMRLVWKSLWPIHTILTWLVWPFDCNVGVQLSHLIPILHCWWAFLLMDYAWGTMFNDIPWDMHLSSRSTPACFVIHNNLPGGVGFMHWVHFSINKEY